MQANFGEHSNRRVCTRESRLGAYRIDLRVSDMACGSVEQPLIVSGAGVICSRLMPTKFCKPTLIPHQKYFLLREHVGNEGIVLPDLRLPFAL